MGAALEAFDHRTLPATCGFLIAFQTPQTLQNASRRRWKKFLHLHGHWRSETAARRREIFARAAAFAGQPDTVQAEALLAVSLAKILKTLQAQLILESIEALFALHPDHDLFGSLAGAGTKLALRPLSQIGDDRDCFSDANALRSDAGTTPISFQSGQMHRVKLRHACAPPCTNGAIAAATSAHGRRPIISTAGRLARVTFPLSAAWDGAGSSSFGRCGRPALLSTKRSISKTSKTKPVTVPGSSNSPPPDFQPLCSLRLQLRQKIHVKPRDLLFERLLQMREFPLP